MSHKKALLNCPFGWGKICRLYQDSIEIAGKSYNLDDLTAIHPTYRKVFGIPSARLELSFGLRHLVLRGISDLEIARLLVSQLLPYCSEETDADHPRSRSAQARNLARAQARAWKRTSKLPVSSDSLWKVVPTSTPDPVAEPSETTSASQPLPLAEPLPLEPSSEPPFAAPFSASLPASADTPDLSEQPSNAPIAHQPSSPSLTSRSRLMHVPRLQPPLRSIRLVHPGQKTLDSCSVPVPALKSSVLPIIHVPVRLQPGECAHYSIGATLCSDRLSGSEHAPYPPMDQGLLILTNRRIFYLGKRGQLILAYTHLWYVSLLHNAIALHLEQQFRRIIIEIEHPQEWASRIEQLSFIARRAHPHSADPSFPTYALPGLKTSSVTQATLKRVIIKPTAAQERTTSLDARTPHDQIDQKIVEARTVSFSEQPYKELRTHEFAHQNTQEPTEIETLALYDQATQEYGAVKTIASYNQTTQPNNAISTFWQYDRDEKEYEESEPLPLHGQNDLKDAKNLDDTEDIEDIDDIKDIEDADDTPTLSLRTQHITDAAIISLRAQINQEFADMEETRPRRVPPGYTSKRPYHAKDDQLD